MPKVIEMTWLTLVPAYGRDYQGRERLLEDWDGGKDFKIADVSSRWNGSYCSRRDFEDGKTVLKIRYDRLERFALVKKVNGRWVALAGDESLDKE